MICSELNRYILKQAPKFLVSEYAPDTFESLNRHIGRLVVWSGNSDNTIYGDRHINYAFRAWHDAIHLKLNANFDLEGETRVAIEQCRLIQSDFASRIIMLEVVEQVRYFNKYGQFPINQLEFIKKRLYAY